MEMTDVNAASGEEALEIEESKNQEDDQDHEPSSRNKETKIMRTTLVVDPIGIINMLLLAIIVASVISIAVFVANISDRLDEIAPQLDKIKKDLNDIQSDVGDARTALENLPF